MSTNTKHSNHSYNVTNEVVVFIMEDYTQQRRNESFRHWVNRTIHLIVEVLSPNMVAALKREWITVTDYSAWVDRSIGHTAILRKWESGSWIMCDECHGSIDTPAPGIRSVVCPSCKTAAVRK